MSGPPSDCTTRELSSKTWKDLEVLFRKYHGVQNGCWCMFYHREGPVKGLSDRARIEKNRTDHRTLVLEGSGHGVLVYEAGRPIGWCQFGRRAELPRLDQGRNYPALRLPDPVGPLWRITCFFVDRPHRHRGVCASALKGALEAIARQGGGTVEAYPATHDRAVAVWFGSERLFQEAGFRTVARFGRSNLVMRRRVLARWA